MEKCDLKVKRLNDYVLEIEKGPGMKVPGRIYADEKIYEGIKNDEALRQVANVAHLDGIVDYSLAMPDIHWGYGFPIGGVAATDPSEGGVISPGGVGYDINCGVRVARTNLKLDDIKKDISKIAASLFNNVPAGVGSSGAIRKLGAPELKRVLREGSVWAVKQGYGSQGDAEKTEEGGRLEDADPETVSDRAIQRGLDQVGTLGSGNHFLELAAADEVYDAGAASALGIDSGTVVLWVHSGSRGLGYQICDDYIKVMMKCVSKYNFQLPDRQLACAPVDSPEGKEYASAMACAANYAWANRQCIMHLSFESIKRVLGVPDRDIGFSLIYDVCHNIAKFEKHTAGGKVKTLCVHRKGATRAFPPGHPDVPQVYKALGQPVLIPGDMGTCSFLCLGTVKAMSETFGTSCHGAGRVMSRHDAMKRARGRRIDKELADKGIVVMARGRGTLGEEMPEAYKDVEAVVNVMHNAGIIRKVVRTRPLAVVKG